MSVFNDIKSIIDICERPYLASNVRIYPCTNENLDFVFSSVDFKDKEVLSVLASSDQLFSAYYLNAKNVDSFDRNRFTKYYYYLRKWSLIYDLVDIPSNVNLGDLLGKVSVSSEEEFDALRFWMELSMKLDDPLRSKIFWPGASVVRKTTYGCDLKGMSDIIKDKTLNFSKLDFFNSISLDKTYDIIVFSNILDYAFSIESLAICRDNLLNHLNDAGCVVCSYVSQRDRSKTKHQDEVFKKGFDLIEGPSYLSSFREDVYYPASYVYVKK